MIGLGTNRIMSAINSLGLISGLGGSGERGPRGSDGVGVSDISYDDPTDRLIFTMTDGTIYNVPFPGLNLNLESDVIISGTNSSSKLQVKNASNGVVLGVNTTSGQIAVGAVLVPGTNHDVGTSGSRFGTIYGNTINVNTSISNSGGYTQSGSSNNTFTGRCFTNGGITNGGSLTQNGTATFEGINNNSGYTQSGLTNNTFTGRCLTNGGITNSGTLTQDGSATFIGITNNSSYVQSGSSNNTFTGRCLTNGGITNGGSLTQNGASTFTADLTINRTVGNPQISFFGGSTSGSIAYISDLFYIDKSLLPVGGSINLGSNGSPFNNVYANSYPAISDGRKKHDVEDEKLGLDFVERLTPVQYKLDSDPNGSIHHGLIVQDVQQVLGQIGLSDSEFGGIDVSDKDNYYMNYMEFVGPLIKAVQELNDIVKQQQVEINRLKQIVGQ